jgi:hypothetical protein
VTKLYKLSELGQLRSGYSSRSDLDPKGDEQPTHWALSMRALHRESRRTIDWSQVDPVVFGKDRKRKTKEIADKDYLLQNGDVLFSMRGLYLTAVYVENPPDKTIVLNNWAILTPKSFVQGRYLVWWFNHPQTQHQIKELARGSGQIFLPMSELRRLKVPIPSQKVQEQIVELNELRQQEKELVQKLENRRNKLFESLTLNLLSQETVKEKSNHDR